MLIVLGVLVLIVVIAVLVWNYRRQTAAREAASAERMKAFLEQARAAPGRAADAPVAAVEPVTRSVRQPDIEGFTARTPLLNTEHLAFFHLLKSALPEHEIFARVSLAAFVRPAENLTGFAREAQERRLADATTDFLVCDQAAQPVAAVQNGVRSGKAAQTAAFAAACVVSTGVRWVEISPQVAVQREEIRRQVLGA